MLHLYIFAQNKWSELELDESFEIALNDSLSNLFNPTEYLTSYSKSITIPLTSKNRKLFNEYVELNSLVIGNRFDPTKPVPVKIFSNSNIVFEGNLKIEKIDLRTNKMAGTVYGDMNKFFVTLKNLTFEENGGLPNLLNANAVIDKNYIYDCWKHDLNELNLEMKLPGESGHYDRDFVGFAPTIQGIPNQFDLESGIWGTTDTSGGTGYVPAGGPANKKFWEIIGDGGAMSEDGVSNATTVMKAPSERVTCQFRSYTQKPFIYINKLIQLFQRLSLEKTGYELVLDEDFFNANNRLYTDVIYTLPNIITETSDSNAVKQEFQAFNYSNYNILRSDSTSPHSTYNTAGTFHTTSTGTLEITGTTSTSLDFRHRDGGNGIGGNFHWNGNAGMRFVVDLIRNGSVSQTKTYKYCGANNNQSYTKLEVGSKYPSPYPPTYSSGMYNYHYQFDSKSFNFKFENLAINADYTVRITVYLEHNGQPGYALGAYCYGQSLSPTALQNTNGTFRFNMSMQGKMYYSTSVRSGSELSMKRLWKEVDGTPFEVVMKYCKMLNLVFDYNNRDRKVTLMTRRKYFENALTRTKNWTDKIDKTKEWSFVPLQWDTKYVTFNYDKLDVDRLADFEKKYNMTYGSKKIDTQYEFNKDNKDFFEGDNNLVSPSATMSEYFYTLDDIRTICDQHGVRTPALSTEHYIINRKGDKAANVSNAFYFRNSNESWQTMRIWDPKGAWSGDPKPFWKDVNCVWITDDSEYELQTNTFCTQFVWRTITETPASVAFGLDGSSLQNNAEDWKCLGNATYPTLPVRPVFSVYDDDGQYCLQYSVPRENYYNPMWVWNANDNDIYNAQWKSYFEETHNVQNKVLTAYFWLSDNDWNEFAFNKYVTIDGVLYIVNKIIDYRPGKQVPTKVELIQIWNTNAYSE